MPFGASEWSWMIIEAESEGLADKSDMDMD